MENNLTKFIVYCTTCTENNKIYIGVHKCNPNIFDGYIGCGVYIKQPHTYNQSKTRFQAAVQKYGIKCFERKTIAIFDNEEDAYLMEADIVNEKFLSRNDVYNMILGGQGGDRGINAKPCYQYDLNGNFIKEFSNRQDASRFVNRGFTTIKRAISDKVPAANFYWSENKTDKLNLKEFKTKDNRIPVFQYYNTGEYECCFESVSDAARSNNSCSTNISRACKQGYLCNNKYFSYEFKTQFSIAKTEQLKNIPIYQYDLNGTFLKEFENIETARKELEIRYNPYNSFKLGKPDKNGWQWNIEKLEKMPDKTIKKPVARSIAQYDLNGNFIRNFNTISEAVSIYGTGVKHCLCGRNKQSKGYTYKYID